MKKVRTRIGTTRDRACIRSLFPLAGRGPGGRARDNRASADVRTPLTPLPRPLPGVWGRGSAALVALAVEGLAGDVRLGVVMGLDVSQDGAPRGAIALEARLQRGLLSRDAL